MIRLATFRIELKLWKKFMATAKSRGTDASAALRAFIIAYIKPVKE